MSAVAYLLTIYLYLIQYKCNFPNQKLNKRKNMKAKVLFFVVSVIAVFLSGCATGGMPLCRIDVFNNISGSVMTLHDRGGDVPGNIPTGSYGWVSQSTYFASDGHDYVDNNTITGRFYDSTTGEYLGLFHWPVSANGYGYQAFHSPYERKQLER